MKKLTAILVSILASASAFAFNAEMTAQQVSAEVQTRSANGQSPDDIARAALAAGVSATAIQSAMSLQFGTAVASQAVTGALTATAAGFGQGQGQAQGQGQSFGPGAGNSSFGLSQNRGSVVGGTGAPCVSNCGNRRI